MTKTARHDRPRRTREHVLADLSLNHAQHQVLHRGWILEHVVEDYGYDAYMLTYDSDGYVEPGLVLFQFKASDRIRFDRSQRFALVSVQRRHLNLWLQEPNTMILAIYDGIKDRAYWLCIQSAKIKRVRPKSASVTVRIPIKNRLNRQGLQRIRAIKHSKIAHPWGTIFA